MNIRHLPYCALLLLLPSVSLAAISARGALETYEDGPVWHMVYIRTETGHQESYLKNLATTWRAQMELAKEKGFVLDYAVIRKFPSDVDDWDILLIEKFPNMAFYDRFNEAFAEVDAEILNDPERERAVGRELSPQRKLLGIQIAREVVLLEPERTD